MKQLTFEELPQAITLIYEKIENIERLLLQREQDTQLSPSQWLDINELCNYLPDKPARATIYGWVHKRLIPYHKGGKKLRFLRSDIDNWLQSGKKKTASEIREEAGNYLQK